MKERSNVRPIEFWLTEEKLQSIYSANYWNDIEEEKKKDYWIIDGNYQRCLDYLDISGLLHEYREAEKIVAAIPKDHIKIADLAAGTGWTSALLSKLPNVSEVHAVEVSQHRLGELFEHSIRMMEGDAQKIYRHLGSFYDLMFDDESIDLIFLSQAFHHADRPLPLLVECDRVLKTGGVIILTGEHHISAKLIIRRFLRLLIYERKFVTTFHDLFPPDRKYGDHYYQVSEYEFMFRTMGYRLEGYTLRNGNVMYAAKKLA